MDIARYILFAISWTAVLYILNSVIAGLPKKIDPKQALLYISSVAMIGVFGEILLDTAYNHFVGHPLWRYNILPFHHGYTSYYALVAWGLYGFHLYLLHGSLADRWSITKTRHLAIIFCFEALLLEALLTLSARAVFGTYLYYYLPSDLWHVSSLQNIPFYFICGVVILKTVRRFRGDPLFFTAMCASLTYVLLFLTN